MTTNNLYQNNKINNTFEAYFLGFLYADGYIPQPQCGKSRGVLITLSAKDKVFLKQLCKKLGFGKTKEKITTANGKKYKCIQYSYFNTIFAEKLKGMGIVCRKTYQNDSFVFDNIPLKFKMDFIRGYFDGDGCVGTVNKNDIRVSFVSLNEKLLQSIQNYLNSFLSDDKSYGFTLRKDGKYNRLRCGSTRICLAFGKKLYQRANFFLDRKKKIFDNSTYKNKKTSKYIGVGWDGDHRWMATICINNKRKFIGRFNTELEAAKAYNEQAIKNNKLKINSL